MAIAGHQNPEFEAATWARVQGTWRQLHGDFSERGVSVEWHDFEIARDLEWSESFHPESVEICLNLSGTGALSGASDELKVAGRSIAMYAQDGDLQGVRKASGEHKFVTVELSRSFLAQQLGSTMDSLRADVRAFIVGERRQPLLSATRMTAAEHSSFSNWASPSVSPAAQGLWYDAKILELLAALMFAPPQKSEMFCDRQKRLGRERMERVMEILRARLQDPPTLEELGREVGCSPFYLSRIFSEQAGQTIPQFIRQLRMERAAELLKEGKMNVTEVAFDVGYSSLGHFSKSFCEVIGVCPSLYPAAAALSRVPRARTGKARQR